MVVAMSGGQGAKDGGADFGTIDGCLGFLGGRRVYRDFSCFGKHRQQLVLLGGSLPAYQEANDHQQ